ncbi:MAG: 6-carboxy-5,6,7,8-tetrahydropterin synthase [Bacteroidia bacterium]|nr:MAG: 6-carboxy-5,6,7,8-tetrahydropterin synthase [Bacteroidia bacterium]
MKTSVVKKISFCAAHRLHNPNWSEEKNQIIFGKCNNPHYHGHNYELHVKVTGNIDPETGFVMDLNVLSEIIKNEIHKRFDHKNLNLDVEEFKTLNTTAENIAMVIYNILRPKIQPHLDLQIILYETPRNYVIYPEK